MYSSMIVSILASLISCPGYHGLRSSTRDPGFDQHVSCILQDEGSFVIVTGYGRIILHNLVILPWEIMKAIKQ